MKHVKELKNITKKKIDRSVIEEVGEWGSLIQGINNAKLNVFVKHMKKYSRSPTKEPSKWLKLIKCTQTKKIVTIKNIDVNNKIFRGDILTNKTLQLQKKSILFDTTFNSKQNKNRSQQIKQS